MKKQRIALVGTGGRGLSFIEPVATTYRDRHELVALADPSPTRLAYYNEMIVRRFRGTPVPTYAAADFDRLLREQKPDLVIVCTIDRTHHEYIVQALDAGADVITEKPMTIDEVKCRAIFDAIARSGRSVRVAFNYRWGQFRTKVKELLAARTIGTVRSVNLEYLLDTSHGADYFRRWHAHMAESGGLLEHKSTHHFDLVNWWLDAIPAQAFAHGDLVFYGQRNAAARGDQALAGYERYTGTAAARNDPFNLDLSSTESFRRLYLEAEPDTGYLRDRNVFRPDIDIFDNMTALVPLEDGATMVPKDGLSLKDILQHFLDFRFATVKRRFEYQLRVLRRRIHILEGFAIIFNALDRAIKLIRESSGKPDAAEKLKKAFALDDEQTTAILDAQLYKIAQMEIQKILEELAEKKKEAAK